MKIIFKPFIFYGLGLFLLSLCLGLAACKPTSTTTSSTTSSTSTVRLQHLLPLRPQLLLFLYYISPASPYLKVGSSIQFRAIGTYSGRFLRKMYRTRYYGLQLSGDTTIDPTGIVTGVEDGTTVIAHHIIRHHQPESISYRSPNRKRSRTHNPFVQSVHSQPVRESR